MIKRLRQRALELLGYVGSVVRTVITRLRRSSFAPTRDWGRTDYVFWDRARRCKAQGLEVAGLFLRPLERKIAGWALGRRPQWRMEHEQSQEALNAWWEEQHPAILRAYRESMGLGDAFLVINSDLTPTIVPPNVVEPLVAEDDYSQIIGWRITEIYEHPERPARPPPVWRRA